jgi:hypothetical protein
MFVGAIAGVVSRQGKADPEAVIRMLEAAPHRGSVIHTLESGNAVLGVVGDGQHSVSSLGAHGRWACALLGPLDNVTELASELGLDHQPADQPVGLAVDERVDERVGQPAGRPNGQTVGQADAARVVAVAFARWGAQTPARLRGAFAGIVTDGERAWSFRDHIGGRTFFFRDDGHTWWGASEAKQVVAGAKLRREPDLDALATTYFRGVSTDSALKGVSRLRYGSVQTVGPHGSTEELHWNPGPEMLETAKLSLDEAVDELATRLSDRFETRVKVALGKTKGRMTVEFASVEDLNRILNVMAPDERGLLKPPTDG